MTEPHRQALKFVFSSRLHRFVFQNSIFRQERLLRRDLLWARFGQLTATLPKCEISLIVSLLKCCLYP